MSESRTDTIADDPCEVIRRASLTRPFVVAQLGQSLDGRVATPTGESRWINRDAALDHLHRLRACVDAVVVGIGTVLADDPLLLPSPRVARPFHRVVFDSRLRLPPQSRLVRSAGRGPVWVVAARDDARRRRALEARGVHVLLSPRAAARVPLAWALRALRAEGLWSLMVEGGGTLLGALLRERLFDEVALFRAPLLMGGDLSRSAFGGPSPRRLRDAVVLGARHPLLGRAARAPGLPGPELCEVWYPQGKRRS